MCVCTNTHNPSVRLKGILILPPFVFAGSSWHLVLCGSLCLHHIRWLRSLLWRCLHTHPCSGYHSSGDTSLYHWFDWLLCHDPGKPLWTRYSKSDVWKGFSVWHTGKRFLRTASVFWSLIVAVNATCLYHKIIASWNAPFGMLSQLPKLSVPCLKKLYAELDHFDVFEMVFASSNYR